LLTLHAKAREWFQFGGHCEPEDQTLCEAAAREVREESGIAELDLDPVPLRLTEHVVPFCGDWGDVRHLDVWFLAIAPFDAEATVSAESLDIGWWPLAGLPGRQDSWGDAREILDRRIG